ncbi:hypothetical protein F4823DRAFT_603214 [Ustulina deusta]|nr:hypothetical protein F4823DRAFT_603214 [Ustulina deusta]
MHAMEKELSPSPRLERLPQGYPKLAQFMAERDHVMFKQFRELAILDILYLQAELCDIRGRLRAKAVQDANQADDRQYFDRDWWQMRHSAELGLDGQQYQLTLEMRKKLREYYTAIQQYRSVSSLPKASEQQRKGLYAYAYYPSTGGYCGFLGQDLGDYPPYPSVLGQDNQQDLLFAGRHQFDDDLATKFLAGPALNAFHWVWKHFKTPAVTDVESVPGETLTPSLYHYPDERILVFLGIVGSVLSSVLPTLSIIILFFVHDMLARLGLVTLFTFLFSLTMSLATKAKRYEIFAATAAFGSVQVVFIGTTNNSCTVTHT